MLGLAWKIFEGGEWARDDGGYGEAVARPMVRTAGDGFAVGTMLPTPNGWRAVETIVPGDPVETLEGDVVPVLEVRRSRIEPGSSSANGPIRLFEVPPCALGNRVLSVLMPEQCVLFDGPIAEELFGTPLVGVRATDLEGHFGICGFDLAEPTVGYRIVFDLEEVIVADGGMMVICPAADDLRPTATTEEYENDQFPVLSRRQAERFLAALEEAGAEPKCPAPEFLDQAARASGAKRA